MSFPFSASLFVITNFATDVAASNTLYITICEVHWLLFRLKYWLFSTAPSIAPTGPVCTCDSYDTPSTSLKAWWTCGHQSWAVRHTFPQTWMTGVRAVTTGSIPASGIGRDSEVAVAPHPTHSGSAAPDSTPPYCLSGSADDWQKSRPVTDRQAGRHAVGQPWHRTWNQHLCVCEFVYLCV